MAKKSESEAGVGGNAAPQLKSLIERVERLNEDKAAVAEDIKQVYQEIKSGGWDSKIVRIIVRRRAMDKMEREHQDALIETYETAVGA